MGFGLSTNLLFVVGSHFKKSGKIYPVGVVSLVSLVMTDGYRHVHTSRDPPGCKVSNCMNISFSLCKIVFLER